MGKKLNDFGQRKWVLHYTILHYTMFFIFVILIFVFFHLRKHNNRMERHNRKQQIYIDHLEQYIHNVTIKETDNKPRNPVIETHQFMDLYDIQRA